MNNNSHNINNPSFILQIISNIERQINRHITDSEEDRIIAYVRNLPTTYKCEYNTIQLQNTIKDNILMEMFDKLNKESHVDTHELLQKIISDNGHQQTFDDKKDKENIVNINLESFFGIDTMSSLVKKIRAPKSSINRAYILLDTRNRELCNDGTEYFRWSHINSLVRGQGTINSIGEIKDIVSANIHNFRMPVGTNAITPYGRISVAFDEFIPQSYVAHEDKRFHFISKISKQVGNWLEICADDICDGIYKFNKPITRLDSLTIRFGSPLEPIIFEKDRLNGLFTHSNPTVITFTENHNLTSNDVVYLSNFTTVNYTHDDSIIRLINSSIGHISTVVSPTSISIPVDSTNISGVLTGLLTSPIVVLGGTITSTINSLILTGIGTNFTVDFVIGDYIQIQNGSTNPVFIITSIQSNTELTLDTPYTETTGVYSYNQTDIVITGIGTIFTTELNPGDNIIISDGGNNPEFIIKSIQSNNTITLTNPYNGNGGGGFPFNINNSLSVPFSVYFGSKRIFLPVILTYLSS